MLHHHRMHVETELAECRDHQRSRVQGDRRVVRGGDSRVGGGPGAATDCDRTTQFIQDQVRLSPLTR